MKSYFWNVLTTLDQSINVIGSPIFNLLFSGDHKFGSPDETLSSVMGKNVKKNNCVLCHMICGVLNMFDKGHCDKSIEKDEG